jgi:hypothetical protein
MISAFPPKVTTLDIGLADGFRLLFLDTKGIGRIQSHVARLRC